MYNNRNQIPKSTKSFTKQTFIQRQHNPQLYNTQFDYCIKSQMNRIQKLINEQSYTRQITYKELQNSIKYLHQTKKSKIKIITNGERLERLFSPNRYNKNQQNQYFIQYKNQINNMKSETLIEAQKNKIKLNEIQKQIKEMYGKIHELTINSATFQNQTISQFKIIHQSIISEIDIVKKEINEENKLIKQIEKLKEQLNFITTHHLPKQQNQVTILDETIRKQIIHFINENQQKLYEKVKENNNNTSNQLRQILSQGIQKHLESQHEWIQKFTKQFQQKITLVDNCIQTSQETLKNFQEQITQTFDALENKINLASATIIQTKQSIEEIFCGSDHKFQEKQKNQTTITCLQPFSRASETNEKINYIENRIKGLERRMDSISGEYLSKPIYKQ